LSGSPSTDPSVLNPTITYLSPGNYTITLTSSTSSGNSTYTFSNFITIHEPPSPNFTANILEDCEGFEVDFTDLSAVFNTSISTWNWDFGDGGSSTDQNPTHQYNVAGEYDVSLSITDGNGCNSILSIDDYINVIEGVQAEFELELSDTCSIPVALSLENNSSGNGSISYEWDFGNGQFSFDENPAEINYNAFGDYTVSLALANNFGCTDETEHSFSIVEKTVLFSASGTCLPDPTQFTNASMDEMNTFLWNFGDPASGTSNSSEEENPSHLFSSAGQYSVSLTASINGACENSYEMNIEVLEAAEIDYSIDQSLICELPTSLPLAINNVDVDSYSWSIFYSEDDNTYSSGVNTGNILFNPAINETPDMTYDFSLEVIFNNACVATLFEEDFFTIDLIQLETFVSPTQLCEGEIVYASDITEFISGIDTYFWDWGDGTTSTLDSDEHEYSAGTFQLNFSLSATNGCTADTSISIQVGNESDPSFVYADTTVCIEDSVPFFYTGDPSLVDSYLWYYESMLAAEIESPYIYINEIDSTHVITLVTINNGCRDSSEQSVSINAQGPKSIFTVSDQFFCKEDDWQISLFNESDITDNTVYKWSFDADYLDTLYVENPPMITYLTSGFQEINLLTTDTVTGCSHETTQYVNIDNFNLYFPNSMDGACDSYTFLDQVLYTDVLPVDIYSLIYYWDFGNGETGTTNPPDTIFIGTNYDEVGDYLMKVHATNSYGCSDTAYQWINVHASPNSSFEISNEDQCPPFNAIINDLSSPGDTSISNYEYLLIAGDSTFYYAQEPLISINTTDSFQLVLTVVDLNGCSSTSVQEFHPNQVTIDYEYPSFLCYNTPFDIETVVQSDLPITDYLWQFGNGTTSSDTVPSVNFNEFENDTLLNYLQLTDSLGCTYLDSFYIYIAHPNFSYSYTIDEASCPPLYSDFSIYSSDSIEYYTIDYGDGESNTLTNAVDAENISHVYEIAGNFDVSFSVTDNNGCTSTIVVDTLVNVPGPWATFSISTNSGCPPVDISFEILDGNGADQFYWVFGDGNSSYLENPVHGYLLSGMYTPVLVLIDTVNFATGDSLPCLVSIPGDDIIIDGPSLDFSVINDTLCYGSDIPIEIENLTTTISGFEIASYFWNYGDGGFSFGENPDLHVYDDAGVFDISLTVTTVNGCEYTLTDTNAVEVLSSPYIFTHVDYDVSCPPMLVNFFSDSSVSELNIENFSWDFGDGNGSQEANPSHLYESTGPYIASISIDYLDCSYTLFLDETIQTLPVPHAAIGSSAQYTNNELTGIELFNESVGADAIEWWLNGSYYSDQNIFLLTNYSENTEVFLVANNEEGCSDSTWFSLLDVNFGLPNVLTPNGDGVNDYLSFNFDSFGTCVHLTVYNRWGNILYENKDYKNTWNGRGPDGKFPSDGTYFYTVELCNNVMLSGYFTLLF